MNEQLTGAQLMGITPPPDPATLTEERGEPAELTLETDTMPAETQPAPASNAHEIMIDATHANIHNIPVDTPKVAGYATGSPDVDWNDSDWSDFPHAGHVRIDQSPGLARYAAHAADVADVETRAGLIPDFVKGTRERLDRGEDGWIYGSRSTIVGASANLVIAGFTKAELDRVGAWLADWNLSEAEAIAMLGKRIAGIRVVAVQWASPTSNASTTVPGGTQTLAEAHVDLSVTEAPWFAGKPQPGTGSVTDGQARAALLKVMHALEGLSDEFDVLEKWSAQ